MLFLIVSVLTLALIIVILIFGAGSACKGTLLGKANEFLLDKLPELIELGVQRIALLLKRILGARIYSYISSTCNYFMNEKHPIVQIFYLILITGGLCIFGIEIAPRIPNSYVPLEHWYFVFVLVVSTYGFFLLASLSDPGKLDSGSASRASEKWPLDHIIYDQKQCRTCLIERPARAKHCSVCKICIAKLDHHCVWINNCVGYLNHRYFLLFLLTTSMYCFYGSYLSLMTLRHLYDTEGIKYLVVTNQDGSQTPASLYLQCTDLMQLHPLLGALGIFSILAGAIVYLFLQYQLYLIMNGLTTSESFKWDDLDVAITNEQITTISPFVLKFNQEYKHGQRLDDYVPAKLRGKNMDFEKDQVPIKDLKLKNIYHRGAIVNLLDVFFPKKL